MGWLRAMIGKGRAWCGGLEVGWKWAAFTGIGRRSTVAWGGVGGMGWVGVEEDWMRAGWDKVG